MLIKRTTLATLLASACLAALAAAGPIQDDPSNRDLDWIAICPGTFRDSVEVLRTYRENNGYAAGIWTLEEIDASYGGHARERIRQALIEAFVGWTIRPRWVVLFGDHFKDGGTGDLIRDFAEYNPELGFWEDSTRGLWPYMAIYGDDIPDVAVGRVPASTPQHVGNYVSKVIRHEFELRAGNYHGSQLLLQDTSDAGNDSAWVRQLADSLHDHFDVSYPKGRVAMSELPCCYPNWEAAAIAAWNGSAELVIAMGTGSGPWMLVHFFDTCQSNGFWHVDKLAPTYRFPALLGLSCGITGTDQAWTCQVRPPAEQLLVSRRDRGACVVIGPTRNTKQWSNFNFGRHLLIAKAEQLTTWGEIHVRALTTTLAEDPTQRDHAFEYVLEGDPATLAFATHVIASEGIRTSGRLGVPVPNPARHGIRFDYEIRTISEIELDVIDIAGRRVASLAQGRRRGGAHHVRWSRSDPSFPRMPGIYFLRLRAAGTEVARRIVIVQ